MAADAEGGPDGGESGEPVTPPSDAGGPAGRSSGAVHPSVQATGPTMAATAPGERLDGPALHVIDRTAYDVRGEIARGGLGRILEAWDQRLDRPVAIKELLAEHLATGGLGGRFAREALLTARLQHPAIVPVYEAGLWPDGAPFYTMKLVEGQSLEAAVRARPTLEERLALLPHVIDVANALAYAHGRRIIHRDLKPANVLVGAFGETVVIDWGLAKELDAPGEVPTTSLPPAAMAVARPGATQAGSVLGTPAYMPPEQALGDPVDERADVYSLGALLYHVLSGGPPYSGKSSAEILAQVAREPPEDLLGKEPLVPPDLAAVVRKALARDPARRYPTAAELASDLSSYQRGQRVSAHRYGALALVARFIKRHRAALTVGALMLALLAIVVVSDVRRIVVERDRAEVERAEAQRLREQADARGDALALREAEAQLGRDPRQALAWLKHLAPDSHAFGAARILAADALARGVPTRVLADTSATSVAFSPDGTLLAVARPDDVLVLDVGSGQSVALADRGGPGRALAFAPDGRWLAYAGAEGMVHVWSRAVRAASDLPGLKSDVTGLVFVGEDRLAGVGRDGTLLLWDLGQGTPPRLYQAHPQAVLDVAFGKGVLATAGLDDTVKLWDVNAVAGAPPLAIFPCKVAPKRLVFSPDGAWVAALGDDPRVHLWNVAARRGGVVEEEGARITAAAFGPRILATGDADGAIHLFDVETRRSVRLVGHDDAVLALAFTADGALVSGGRDHTVRVWDVRSGRSRVLLGHDGDVTALALAGPLLATAARDRSVRLWNLASSQPRIVVQAERPLFALAASADGKRIAAGGAGSLYVVDGTGRRALAAVGERVRALAFSPDGAQLAAGLESGHVRLYGLNGAARDLEPQGAPIQVVAFDGGGQRVAAGGAAGLSCWSTAGTRRFADESPVVALAFVPGRGELAAAGSDLVLWDAGGKARRLAGLEGPFVTVAASADGRRVAAGGRAGVAVWDVDSGAGRVLGSDALARVAFSSDGKLLVGVAGDRTLRVWDVESGQSRRFSVDAGTLMDVGAMRTGSAATAGSDGAVRIWDLASGRSRRAGNHERGVFGLALVDEGRAIASAGEDGTVRIWPDALPEDPAELRAFLLQATDAKVGEGL